MAREIIWSKLRSAFFAAGSVGTFGLCSFVLLLLKNQNDRSFVYILCISTVIYGIVLFIQFRLYRHMPEDMKRFTARTRLIFRWIYVALYLTLIIINMIYAGWNGSLDFSNRKLLFQVAMFIFIALTIPRDILLRKVYAWAKLKWSSKSIEL